ncbi:MAG: hypothetical protein K2Y23_00650 [Cyanobacteria bacterium]|nr:hypothetical protein [Cyanobacteriota bacterium]
MSFLSRSCRHFTVLLFFGWLVYSNGPAGSQVALARAANGLPCPVNMRLLVISANGGETVLPAIRETLDYLGTPYDLHIASGPSVLTAATLESAPCQGRYQGIILTTGELGYFNSEGAWGSALTADEWTALRQYEATYKVRQATWYTYPTPQFGYNIGYAVDTGLTPITAAFTAEGAKVFSYLNTTTPVTIANAYTYLATPLGFGTTPLLVTADGHALVLVNTATDGREELSMTFDGNQYLLHSISLGYGLVRWVTRGVFLGERHAYMSPQVDDLFIGNDQWVAATPCGTPVDMTGYSQRSTASDLKAVLDWQTTTRLQPVTRNLKLTMAFNAYGATNGAYTPDDLTPFLTQPAVKSQFHWVSHTFTHLDLDAANAATTRYELNNNISTARTLALPGFTASTLVTPNISGLTNATFLRVAQNIGVRYLVSDTSRAGYSNPSPNTGIPNPLRPGIFMIPRYPNNLFFNVAAPADWAAEYNCMYRGFWGRDLTYAEILDIESQRLLTYLLKGDMNPWMFHQPNLDVYNGNNTLLTDLLGATINKYRAITNLPILSPPMQDIGELMKARATYNNSGVTATWQPDGSVKISVTQRAVIPITGLAATGAEQYGDQKIAHITVTPRAPVTVKVP